MATVANLTAIPSSSFKDFMTNPYAWVAVLFAVIFAPVTVLVMTRVVKALRRKTTEVGNNAARISFSSSRVSLVESRRARLRAYLYAQTRIGLAWELTQTALSLVSCIMYIISTYYVDCIIITATVDQWLENGVVFCFAADFALQFYLAQAKIAWFLSPVALADLITIVPTLLQLFVAWGFHEGVASSAGCSGDTTFFKFVRLVRFLRVVRALRLFRVSRAVLARDSVSHHVARIVTTLLTLTFVSACLFQYVENCARLNSTRQPTLLPRTHIST